MVELGLVGVKGVGRGSRGWGYYGVCVDNASGTLPNCDYGL